MTGSPTSDPRSPIAHDAARRARSGFVTRVSVVRAWVGALCAAGVEEGCENPLILRGSQRSVKMAVVVNIAVDEAGVDVPTGVTGARWSRQVVFHPECYERVGRAIWGEPTNGPRPPTPRQANPRPIPFST